MVLTFVHYAWIIMIAYGSLDIGLDASQSTFPHFTMDDLGKMLKNKRASLFRLHHDNVGFNFQ